MLLLKTTSKLLLKGLFANIFIAAFLAILVWFLGNVLFHLLLWSFVETWRNVYILISAIDLVLIIGFKFLFSLVSWSIAARKIGITFSEMQRAVIEAELHKKKPIAQWDADWVKKSLVIDEYSTQIAKELAHASIEVLRKRR